MTRTDMGPKLQPPADSLGPVAQSTNTTKEANKKDTVAESHDEDISEAFTLLQAKMKINSTTVTDLTKTATTPGTTENVGFGPEERKAKLIKLSNNALMEKIESDAAGLDAVSHTGSISSWSVKL